MLCFCLFLFSTVSPQIEMSNQRQSTAKRKGEGLENTCSTRGCFGLGTQVQSLLTWKRRISQARTGASEKRWSGWTGRASDDTNVTGSSVCQQFRRRMLFRPILLPLSKYCAGARRALVSALGQQSDGVVCNCHRLGGWKRADVRR